MENRFEEKKGGSRNNNKRRKSINKTEAKTADSEGKKNGEKGLLM